MPVNGKFELMTLGYRPSVLEPYISEKTILMHHGVHLATYVNNLNTLIAGTEWEGKSLEEIVKHAPDGPILNNAGQILNHNMYFEQLVFNEYVVEGYMSTELTDAIGQQFNPSKEGKDDYDKIMVGRRNFYGLLHKAGLTLFGSGWVWLSMDNQGKFVITQEPNAGNPLRRGLQPLLTIDVWEHAYYLDYQSRRGDYLGEIWNVFNWNVPTKRYLDALDTLERTVSLK